MYLRFKHSKYRKRLASLFLPESVDTPRLSVSGCQPRSRVTGHDRPTHMRKVQLVRQRVCWPQKVAETCGFGLKPATNSSSTPANFRRQRRARARARTRGENMPEQIIRARTSIRRPSETKRKKFMVSSLLTRRCLRCQVHPSTWLFVPVGFLLFPAPHASRGGTARRRTGRREPPSFGAHGWWWCYLPMTLPSKHITET